MTTEKKPLQVIFAPGCFDHFDGTQEELDDLVAEINKMVKSGEIFDKSNPIDPDTMSEEELEMLANIMKELETDDEVPPKRRLN
jgi:hypothetical protein